MIEGRGARIDIDFRPFINGMRYKGEQIEKSLSDPDLREKLLIELANEFLMSNGYETGATDASIEAVQQGKYLQDKPYTDNGVTHYATAYVGPKGIYIDPTDQYDRHYGEFSVYNGMGHTDITEDPEVYDIIYDAFLKAIAKG